MSTTDIEMEDVNLDAYDATFETAKAAEANDYENVPEGIYRAVIERAYFKKAKTSGRDMLHWQLKILGPTHAGRKLFRNSMLDKPEYLKKDLITCGIKVTKLSALNLDDLLDLELEVKVKNGQGDSQWIYFNKLIETTIEPERSATASAGARQVVQNAMVDIADDDDSVPF